jgi:hypothetical protein
MLGCAQKELMDPRNVLREQRVATAASPMAERVGLKEILKN